MTKKFQVWCDSGANIHSKYKTEIEIDFTDSEWNSMSDDEKDEYMKDIAFARLDWGYREL